jgi:hypothetical protein
MHSIAQGTDTNIFWSNQAWLACSEWRIVPIDSLIGPETYTPIEDLYFSTRGPRTLGALTQSRPASLLGLCERCNRSITINLRHRKDQRIDNNLTDTINYRHSSLDAAYYYQAQLLATQDNDGDLPFQCYLKAWMSKYSLPRYSHIPLYRIHSVGDLLPGTTIGYLDLSLSWKTTPTLWTWMESTGWTLHWQKATYTFPIRIGSTDLSCPSRTAYSLVLLIGSGIGPIGALSGLKGFILLNSSGLRQRVKNRYSQHVVWLRLLLLSPL